MTEFATTASRVTVVMITHNRRDQLDQTLTRLEPTVGDVRVIVVDNGSDDGTVEMVQTRHPGVEVIGLPDNAGAVGRNIAIERVHTPYVAFCDDDTVWQPGSLERGVALLDAHPGLATVTGKCLVEPELAEDPITPEMRGSPLRRPEWMPGPALLGIMAGLTMIRTDAFRQAGGFCERYWLGGEEELLALDLAAAGWHMVWDEQMVIHHRPSVRRDPTRRRQLGIRNTLWTLWLRRPAIHALQRSWRIVASAPRDRVTLGAVAEAARSAGWVLRHRKVVPDHVEAGLRTLEHSQDHSVARQYVG
ncbi:glycosyltransferase family 2 protein [Gordonia sp. DT30]|uniref:glycosyltransferase family 2 protein n=1 Tax=unclassified Gordonia (in: high G+C Gram-positive bacteria) TaxID=2657482 RepID=UPI003CF84023